MFIRCEDPKTINAMNAYEVNIFDKRPDQAYRTGAIVDVAKPEQRHHDRRQVEHHRHHREGPEADRADQRDEDGGREGQQAREGQHRPPVRRGHGEVPERPTEDAVALSPAAMVSARLKTSVACAPEMP